jgi:hypothetical protein
MKKTTHLHISEFLTVNSPIIWSNPEFVLQVHHLTNKRILIHVWARSAGTVTDCVELYHYSHCGCLVRQSRNFMFAAPLAPEVCVADRGALVKFPRSVQLPASVWVTAGRD